MSQVRVERDPQTNQVSVIGRNLRLEMDGDTAISLGEDLLSKGTAAVLDTQQPRRSKDKKRRRK